MSTTGSGGYLLHAIKVYVGHVDLCHHDCKIFFFRYDDPAAMPVEMHRRPKVRKTGPLPASEGEVGPNATSADLEGEGPSSSGEVNESHKE